MSSITAHVLGRAMAEPADSTVTAMYLTPVGAYISVTRGETKDGIADITANCEACGHLQYGERHAQQHAETCRRLPERLWPKAGA